MKPLVLFWGIVNVPEYAYRFVLSQAKIEIMSMDIPYTDYNVDEKENSKKENNELVDRLNEESARKMRARLARQNEEKREEINLTEFLNEK